MDFIKNDCVFGGNFNTSGTYTNIEAARKAMDKTGHTFVYSLSPGFGADTPGPDGPANALKITSPLVNMYRMTSDWHGWHGADNKPGCPITLSWLAPTRAGSAPPARTASAGQTSIVRSNSSGRARLPTH